MSEALAIVNLVLGIIGTITGSIAVFVHYWRLKRENPHLEIRISSFEHDFAISKSQIKTISFWASLQVKNLGDRGTSINDVDLSFVSDRKKYTLKKRLFIERPAQHQRIWINPHETLDISTDFWTDYDGEERERFDCTLTIYHTHGSKEIKSVSQKREQQTKEI